MATCRVCLHRCVCRKGAGYVIDSLAYGKDTEVDCNHFKDENDFLLIGQLSAKNKWLLKEIQRIALTTSETDTKERGDD